MYFFGTDAIAPTVTIDISVTVFIMMYSITLKVFPNVNGVFRYQRVPMMDILIDVLSLDLLDDFRGARASKDQR